MRGTHSCNNCKMQGLVFKLTTTSVVEKLILTENFSDRSQLDAYTMSKLRKVMVWPKIEKQMRNKRNRSCYAITDDTKIWAITINYHHQTFSHCLAAFKELHLKKKMLSVFPSPLPNCLILSFYLSFLRLSHHAEDTKCVTSTGPSLSFPPGLTGWPAVSQTDLPLAQPRASPPGRARGSLRPKIHKPQWSRSKQGELSQKAAEEGLLLQKINMQIEKLKRTMFGKLI